MQRFAGMGYLVPCWEIAETCMAFLFQADIGQNLTRRPEGTVSEPSEPRVSTTSSTSAATRRIYGV